jgi:hypothetical protein
MKNTIRQLTLPRLDALDSLANGDAITALLDDKGVRGDINEVNWPKQFPYRPMSSFAAAYSTKAIYIDFLVRCNYLRAENYTDQSPVSQDSCVEFFVKPQPDGEYWNFEFNCIGTINASHRRERPAPTRLSADELSRVKRYASCGTRPFCEVEGLFTWNLLVVIPLDLIGLDIQHLPDYIEGNFYKCASATSEPHYLSWAPITTEKPDFHRPEFFGKIFFDKTNQ